MKPARSPFLRAKWKNLLLVTYKVPDDLLRPYLTSGIEFDRLEGSALVSLVAFDFCDTRVKGLRFPGFTDFPEVNLRFYGRHGERRGVVFVREFVPSRLIAWTARALYNEPYRAVPMESHTFIRGTQIRIEHHLTIDGRTHHIEVEAEGPPNVPPADSREHFLKEQEWGFGRSRSGELLCYRVEHPWWKIYLNPRPTLNVDFAALYGAPWSVLQNLKPFSVVLAEGSDIAVWPKEKRGQERRI
jgi:uncharacterized protein YqjF (DUF2071 family)